MNSTDLSDNRNKPNSSCVQHTVIQPHFVFLCEGRQSHQHHTPTCKDPVLRCRDIRIILLSKLKDFPAHEPVLQIAASVKEEESISASFMKILRVTAAWKEYISATLKIHTR